MYRHEYIFPFMDYSKAIKSRFYFKSKPSIFCCTSSATGKRAKWYTGSLDIVTSHDCFLLDCTIGYSPRLFFCLLYGKKFSHVTYIDFDIKVITKEVLTYAKLERHILGSKQWTLQNRILKSRLNPSLKATMFVLKWIICFWIGLTNSFCLRGHAYFTRCDFHFIQQEK